MPCHVEPLQSELDQWAKEDAEKKKKSAEKAKAEREAAARLEEAFCWAMTTLEEVAGYDMLLVPFVDMPDSVREIWETHEKKEIARVKKEALAKLSKREKRILGL